MDAEEERQRCKQAAAQRQCRNGKKGGTRGHANKARIGQRIAKQPLHHRTRNGKGSTDHQPKPGARQAHGLQNDAVARIHALGTAGEIKPEFMQAHACRAACQRHETGEKQDEAECAKRHDALAGAISWHPSRSRIHRNRTHGLTISG